METITHPVFFAVFIYILSLFFAFWRPHRLSIAWPPLIGALLIYLFGVLTWTDVVEVIGRVWNAALSILSLVLLAISLGQIGMFEWAAIHMVRLSRGNGRLLLLNISLMTGLVAAIFSAYAAVFILTPVMIQIARKINGRGTNPIPLTVTVAFMSAAAALPFTISHPINQLAADMAQVGFLSFLLRMAIPFVVALAVSAVALMLFFMRRVPAVFSVPTLKHPYQAIRNLTLFRLAWVMVVLTAVGYVFGDLLGIPSSLVALLAAVCLMVAVRRMPDVSVIEMVREAPWSLMFFMFGVLILIYGFVNVDLALHLSEWLAGLIHRGPFVAVLGSGFVSALLAALIHQIPSTFLFTESILATETSPLIGESLFYAQLIGAHYGQLLAPFGTVAALMAVDEFIGYKGRDKRQEETGIAAGLTLAVPILFLTLCGLYLGLKLLHLE